MTTEDVTHEVVVERLARIRDFADELSGLGEMTAQRLRDDTVVRYAAERLVTLMVDAAVGLNAHVAAKRLDRVATSYAGSFDLAARAGVLEPSFAAGIRDSAKLRNLLIHNYAEIDYDLLASAFARIAVDYAEYVRQVASWLEQRMAEQAEVDEPPADASPSSDSAGSADEADGR